MKLKKKSSPLKLLSQSQPNFVEMILGLSPFKIESVITVLYPRWPPLLKIEISSNGQNCSILSQKVPKFELYKHNDELFSSPVTTERRPSVNFSHFNQLLWNHWANLNQTLVEWSLDGPLPKLCPMIPTSNQDGCQTKNRKKGDEILIVHCCFSISQNELKF